MHQHGHIFARQMPCKNPETPQGHIVQKGKGQDCDQTIPAWEKESGLEALYFSLPRDDAHNIPTKGIRIRFSIRYITRSAFSQLPSATFR